MPLLRITTSASLAGVDLGALVDAVTDSVAKITDKDEDYVMVLVDEARGGLGGRLQPVVYVDVRAIGGLYESINQRLAAAVTQILSDRLKLPADAVYLTFTTVRAENWGWNGRTFD